MASATRRIKLGPGVTNPYSRNMTMVAYQALTLEELAPRRTLLGLGPGGSIPFTPLRIPVWNKPVKAVRESVQLARAVFSGEEVTMDGEFVKANKVKSFLGQVNIPIYLAARGTQMLKLAGELSDGTLLSSPPKYLRYALSLIKDSAKAAGRDPTSVDTGAIVVIVISDDTECARKLALHSAFRRTRDSPIEVLDMVGIKASEQEAIKSTFRQKGEQEAFQLVTDRMIDAFTVAGDAEYCVRRCREYLDTGITNLMFGDPFGPEAVKSLEMVTGKVIPALIAEI
jgi:5,10-methylenetetrahydromethanopterin reductase